MYEIDDLPNKPGHLIRLAHQKAISVFSDATQNFNITAVQHVIMVALNRFPDIDLSNLAQIVGLDRSTTGNVAARLSDRGLVKIKTSEADRRAKIIRLSNTGETLLAAMSPSVKLSQERLLEALTEPERESFFRILQKLTGKAYPKERNTEHFSETDPSGKPATRAHIDRTDEKIAAALWSYVSDIPSRAAIFPRLVTPETDVLTRLLGGFLDIREEVLRMVREENRNRFVFVLAFTAPGVADHPVALGMKHAWMGLVREIFTEIKNPAASLSVLTWAPPVRQSRKTFNTPSSLSQKSFSGLGELTRYFLFDTVEIPGLTIVDNVVNLPPRGTC
ncbi:MarR family winged helix-turn-helix transcriptional regulator [Antarcticimicrobium sediminis]|uniref:MarR family transcriptional regulator n=1 Tax=Antarcticimicrobium sediminis TaxID=2546227 RepID=A0A4R5EJW8_9RHOB|nr:MarR family winged helix-turn-helix transcriptional regulator [Antarcticimicrobium sediminis]TDE34660.1 MarR family transcriptional regulator [Antarcticimicrobium sediminis]